MRPATSTAATVARRWVRGLRRPRPSSASLSASLGRPACVFSSNARSENDNADATTHFGYAEVPSSEKKGMVADVFSGVARNYDVMNDLMSAGIHRVWKDNFVASLRLHACGKVGGDPPRILDVAGGTGDIAFRMLDDLRPFVAPMRRGSGGGSNTSDGIASFADGSGTEEALPPLVTVSDINPDMLEVGRARAAARYPPEAGPAATALAWRVADAEALPFKDDSFDLYTIAFGLRNVTDIDQALREARRVLRRGGRFACLEFSRVRPDAVRWAYDAYSEKVIPAVGEVVANDRAAYQYLVESIRMFPSQEELEERMAAAGLAAVSYTDMSFGVVAAHTGFKL